MAENIMSYMGKRKLCTPENNNNTLEVRTELFVT